MGLQILLGEGGREEKKKRENAIYLVPTRNTNLVVLYKVIMV